MERRENYESREAREKTQIDSAVKILSELVEAGKSGSEIENFLQKNHHIFETRFVAGNYAGYNYGIDVYRIDLPSGKTLFYEIHGTHTSVVAASEVMSREDADKKSNTLGLVNEMDKITTEGYRGDKHDRERTLKDLLFLREQVQFSLDHIHKRQHEKGEMNEKRKKRYEEYLNEDKIIGEFE